MAEGKPAHPAFGPNAVARDVDVLDSHMHYVEAGEGDPVIFLHGNPTSSFLWRNIVSRLDGKGRMLALDLIGYGESGKPDIEYSLADHDRYLAAWCDALELDNVTVIAQDWGGAYGVTWARTHPDRVKGLGLLEPVLRDNDASDLPDVFVERRARILTDEGERIILDENAFMTHFIPETLMNPLPEEDMAVYRAPFPTRESRIPILVGPRSLPLDGHPETSVKYLEANEPWLSTSETPKLLLTYDPGFCTTPQTLEWAKNTIGNLEVEHVGPGIHFVQEDDPEGTAKHLGAWLDRINA